MNVSDHESHLLADTEWFINSFKQLAGDHNGWIVWTVQRTQTLSPCWCKGHNSNSTNNPLLFATWIRDHVDWNDTDVTNFHEHIATRNIKQWVDLKNVMKRIIFN